MNPPCPFTAAAVENAMRNTERFRGKCNELIAAIEKVRDDYFTHHPDTPGSEVARTNADHILRILPPLYDVLEWLSDDCEDYGAEDSINDAAGCFLHQHDAIDAVRDFITRTIPVWENDEQEERV